MITMRRLRLVVTGAVWLLSTTLISDVVAVGNSTKLELTGWYPCSANTFKQESDPTADDGSTTNNTSSATASGPGSGLGDGVPLPAQCATFKAPLCYPGVCTDPKNKEIDIFVKRITAVADGKPNVFFMQGGPGAASPAMESAMISLHTLLQGNVNVYTMDHRGTGRSTKLDCVAAEAQLSGSPDGTSVGVEEVPSCADELEKMYGSDLASFSVTSAASDLNYFISKYLTASTTFVYGVSYGTSLVERLIHLNTTEIAGYVLDGIATTSGSTVDNFEYFSTWDRDYDEVAQYFLSFCEKNEEDCGKYFKGSTLVASVKKLIAQADDKSFVCRDVMSQATAGGDMSPSNTLRLLFGELVADASIRNLIPVLTYRLLRCNADDKKVLEYYFEKKKEKSPPSEDDWFSSDLTYKIIVYSEFWESPAPSLKLQTARFVNTTASSGTPSETGPYCAFTKDQSASCADFKEYTGYNASPIAYKKDKYWNVAASPPKDVSVLLLSSKMDPQTPHKFAERLLAAMKTDNKELVTFETATHGTLWTTPLSDEPGADVCGMLIVASYVKNGGDLKAMDKSCVAKMPALNYKLDESWRDGLLNVAEAFDGEFRGNGDSVTSNGTYKVLFVVFAVLFVMVSIAAMLQTVKLHRRRPVGATYGGGATA